MTFLAAPDAKKPAPTALEAIRQEAKAVSAAIDEPLVRKFLGTVSSLKAVPKRTLYHDAAKTKYWTESEKKKLPRAVTQTVEDMRTAGRVERKIEEIGPLAAALPKSAFDNVASRRSRASYCMLFWTSRNALPVGSRKPASMP